MGSQPSKDHASNYTLSNSNDSNQVFKDTESKKYRRYTVHHKSSKGILDDYVDGTNNSSNSIINNNNGQSLTSSYPTPTTSTTTTTKSNKGDENMCVDSGGVDSSNHNNYNNNQNRISSNSSYDNASHYKQSSRKLKSKTVNLGYNTPLPSNTTTTTATKSSNTSNNLIDNSNSNTNINHHLSSSSVESSVCLSDSTLSLSSEISTSSSTTNTSNNTLSTQPFFSRTRSKSLNIYDIRKQDTSLKQQQSSDKTTNSSTSTTTETNKIQGRKTKSSVSLFKHLSLKKSKKNSKSTSQNNNNNNNNNNINPPNKVVLDTPENNQQTSKLEIVNHQIILSSSTSSSLSSSHTTAIKSLHSSVSDGSHLDIIKESPITPTILSIDQQPSQSQQETPVQLKKPPPPLPPKNYPKSPQRLEEEGDQGANLYVEEQECQNYQQGEEEFVDSYSQNHLDFESTDNYYNNSNQQQQQEGEEVIESNIKKKPPPLPPKQFSITISMDTTPNSPTCAVPLPNTPGGGIKSPTSLLGKKQNSLLPPNEPHYPSPSSSQRNSVEITYLEDVPGYVLLDKIGCGTFSEVHLGKHKATEKQYAIKIIDKSLVQMIAAHTDLDVSTEVNILKSLSHPNVIQLHEHFETDSNYYIVMELLHGGELLYQIEAHNSRVEFDTNSLKSSSGITRSLSNFSLGGGDILQQTNQNNSTTTTTTTTTNNNTLQQKQSNQFVNYTEDSARPIIKQIVEAVSFLHSNQIIHRDLKPENILFKDTSEYSTLKIIDFGLASYYKNEPLIDICGSPYFQAPEMIKRQGYSYPVDIWATGVILFILLCGHPPFQGRNAMAITAQIMRGEIVYDQDEWGCISTEAKDLVKGMLTIDPTQRLTSTQILQHPWILKEYSDVDGSSTRTKDNCNIKANSVGRNNGQKIMDNFIDGSNHHLSDNHCPTSPKLDTFHKHLRRYNSQRYFKSTGDTLLKSQRFSIYSPEQRRSFQFV